MTMCSMLVPATKPTCDFQGVSLSSREYQRRDVVLKNNYFHIRFGWTLEGILHKARTVSDKRGSRALRREGTITATNKDTDVDEATPDLNYATLGVWF